MPICLNFTPISCMGPRNSPKDTHVIFSNNFGAVEPVLVVQIWIMHIKCPETKLMYKKRNEPEIVPKFIKVLLFGLIWLCKKIKAGEGSVRMSFRTRSWHVPSRNHEPSWGKLRFARSLHQSFSQFGQKKLPKHVGAMSWHHAKFHDFQASFGITRIKKSSFSIFSAEPRRPDVWISLPSLAWDLEIHPRTHMWFFQTTLVHWSMCL